jgi:hypothetical protein
MVGIVVGFGYKFIFKIGSAIFYAPKYPAFSKRVRFCAFFTHV